MIFVPCCFALKRFFQLPPVIFSTRRRTSWSIPFFINASKSSLDSSFLTDKIKIAPLGNCILSNASIAFNTEAVLERWKIWFSDFHCSLFILESSLSEIKQGSVVSVCERKSAFLSLKSYKNSSQLLNFTSSE